MQVRQYAVPGLVVMAVTLWMLGCGETPTSPGAPNFKKGKPPTQTPKIALANLILASTVFTIDGAGVNYTVDIVNSGGKRTGVILQAEIAQSNTLKAAGGIVVECGDGQGVLPRGTCPMAFGAGASNQNAGGGDLVAGAANLILRVLAADGSQLAGLVTPITLQ